jgi:hypothetical protein
MEAVQLADMELLQCRNQWGLGVKEKEEDPAVRKSEAQTAAEGE